MRKKIRVFGLVSLFLAVAFIGIGSYFIREYYLLPLDRFNYQVSNDNPEAAREELDNLRYFYDLTAKWKVKWLADRFLFRDAYLRDAQYYFLIGDFQRVINDENLKNSDDYRAAQLVGSAMFRDFKARYENAKTSREREEIVKLVVSEVSSYFEKALRKGPAFSYPDANFDYRWNYDIASDPSSAKRAMESKQPMPRFKLGLEPGQSPRDKPEPSDRKLNEEKQPGTSPNKRGG